jgi:hypothetical protein
LGVTCSASYNVTLNDYGGSGPQISSGTYGVPLWNYAYSRPNPISDYDPLPLFYRWTPGSGPTIYFEYANLPGATLNFYYAQRLPQGDSVSGTYQSGSTPLAALRLTFESVLGTGPEFGSTYASQQILYPHYAGVGSPNFDLGYSGIAPSVRVEILGSYPAYASGDADFTDIVADLFGRAVTQAGFTGS